MAFTDESAVRNHSGLTDPEAVPAERIAHAIAESHAVVLGELPSDLAESEDEILRLAETELATALLYRGLAGTGTALGRDVASLHFRIRETGRGPELRALADAEEKRARGRLRRFLSSPHEPFGFELVEPD